MANEESICNVVFKVLPFYRILCKIKQPVAICCVPPVQSDLAQTQGTDRIKKIMII